MPLNEAFAIMIRKKKKEDAAINRKVKALLKRKQTGNLAENKTKISIIPRHEYLSKYVSSAYDRAEKEMIWLTQAERVPIAIDAYRHSMKKAFARGVQLRSIAEFTSVRKETVDFICRFKTDNPQFDIRFANNPLSVTFAIRDGEELNFFTEQSKGLTDSPALYTNNPQIIKVIKEYFELTWKSSIKVENLLKKIEC